MKRIALVALATFALGASAQQAPSPEERMEALTSLLGQSKVEAGECIANMARLMKENRELKAKLAELEKKDEKK